MHTEKHEKDSENLSIQEPKIETAKSAEGDKGGKEEDSIDSLKSQIDALKNQVVLGIADNENLRKRFMRELDDAKKYSISGFANDLVDVLENLYRATESIEAAEGTTAGMQNISDGVLMTQKLLLSVFEKYGMVRLYPLNCEFDHRYHQALSRAPDPEKATNTILQVVQAGYTLHSRLLRPALVIVAE